MTPPRPGPAEMARRQRIVRVAVGALIFGLLVQAQTFLSPGLWRFLGFIGLGASLVVVGAALAAVAMFGPLRPTPPPPPPPPATPAEAEEMGPT